MSLKPYPAYKNSGVTWLGDVPEHWKVLRLKRLAEIQNGSDYKHVETFGEGYPVIGSGGPFTSASQYMFNGESVLLGRKGTIDKPLYINGPFWAVDTMFYTTIKPNIFAKYLYYCALTIRFDLYSTSTALPSMTQTDLANIQFAVPEYSEQAAIAAFLDRETGKIDELIVEQEKLIALLAEKRQATISHAVTKGLNPAAPMKDSGVEWLGQIPAHWSLLRIADHFGEVSEPGLEELPVLSVSIHDGVSDDELLPDEVERKVTRSEDRTKYKRVAPNDLVYNMMRAWQGGFGTVQVDGMVSPAYVVARPKTQTPTQYIEYILRTQNAVQEMKRYSRGVTDFRLRLYWDEFKNIKVGFAPPHEQAEILNFIGKENLKLDALAEEANRVIDLLKERRTALISAAVTGKIDVRRPSAQIIDLAVVRRRVRGLLAVELIEKSQGRNTFGRTALQKHAYLAEVFVGVHEMNGNYVRNAYGPLDSEMIDDMESEAQALCGIVTQPPSGMNRSVTYLLSQQAGSLSHELAQRLGPERISKLQRLHTLLAPLNTHEAEAVATLFAVWNDFLIEEKDPNDDEIVNGFLNDWHPKKIENFNAQELHLRLDWMRRNGLVPTGAGPKTETGRLFV